MNDLRRHAKNANFGLAHTISASGAEMILQLITDLVILRARADYAEEREYPEYIDLGGEA